jgi:hypothetical protein
MTNRSDHRPRFQVTIRGLMIVVLYSAVVSACVVLPMHLAQRYRALAAIGVALAWPIVLIGLTKIVFRPGPRRDLVNLPWRFATILMLVGFFALPLWAPVVFRSTAGSWPAGLTRGSIFLTVLYTSLVSFQMLLYLPVRCPCCGRHALVVPSDRIRWERRKARPSPPNPLPLGYRWCGVCGARLKCFRRPEERRFYDAFIAAFDRRLRWEDASGSDDHQFYWQWHLPTPGPRWMQRRWKPASHVAQPACPPSDQGSTCPR